MKKTVLIFGGISGLILALMFAITLPLYKSGTLNFGNGEYVGYTSMVISLSMIFFGIKSYRDNQLAGKISFGKGFQVGILIALVASLIYVISWEICLKLFYPNFMDDYVSSMVSKKIADGATADQMTKLKSELVWMQDLYKSPVKRFAATLMEIFPMGLVFALVFSAILRKKEVLPAQQR